MLALLRASPDTVTGIGTRMKPGPNTNCYVDVRASHGDALTLRMPPSACKTLKAGDTFTRLRPIESAWPFLSLPTFAIMLLGLITFAVGRRRPGRSGRHRRRSGPTGTAREGGPRTRRLLSERRRERLLLACRVPAPPPTTDGSCDSARRPRPHISAVATHAVYTHHPSGARPSVLDFVPCKAARVAAGCLSRRRPKRSQTRSAGAPRRIRWPTGSRMC